MRTSESTANIAPALVRLHTMLENPTKTQRVQAGAKRYSFAPLPDILEVVRPTLALHGLALVQEASAAGQLVAVITRVFHTSGEWIEFSALALPAGSDAQAAGSAITYARRYALCAALGIAADEDDDGRSSSPAPAPGGTKRAPARQPNPSPSRAGEESTAPVPGDTSAAAGPEGAPQQQSMEAGEDSVDDASSGSLHRHEYAPVPDKPGMEACLHCGRARRMSEVPTKEGGG